MNSEAVPLDNVKHFFSDCRCRTLGRLCINMLDPYHLAHIMNMLCTYLVYFYCVSITCMNSEAVPLDNVKHVFGDCQNDYPLL